VSETLLPYVNVILKSHQISMGMKVLRIEAKFPVPSRLLVLHPHGYYDEMRLKNNRAMLGNSFF